MLLLVLDSSQRLGIVEGVVAKHTLMLCMLMIDDDLILGSCYLSPYYSFCCWIFSRQTEKARETDNGRKIASIAGRRSIALGFLTMIFEPSSQRENKAILVVQDHDEPSCRR